MGTREVPDGGEVFPVVVGNVDGGEGGVVFGGGTDRGGGDGGGGGECFSGFGFALAIAFRATGFPT